MKTLMRCCALICALLCGGLALSQTTSTPNISPSSRSFTGSLSVSITDSTPSSTIFYTTDGSTPLTGSPSYLFNGVVSDGTMLWNKTCYIGSSQCSGGVGSTPPQGTPTAVTGLNSPSAGTGTSNAVAHYAFKNPQTGHYTQVLWTSKNGASRTAGAALYITNDFWEKSVFAAGKSNFEFDSFLSTSGWLYMFGTQCSGASGYKIEYDNEGHGWVTTGIGCLGMLDGNYHHVVMKYHRDANTSTSCSGAPCEHFDSIQIDSTVYPINKTLPATKTTWGEIAAPQFQIDGSPTSASSGSPALYDLYIDTDRFSASSASTTSPVYSGPLTINTNTTVKAVATASGYATSPVASAIYTTGAAAPAPVISPSGGTFTTTQYITLSDTLGTAVIYYTTDGTTPTTSSNVYSVPLEVTDTATIKAMAAAPGYTNSPVVSATYTFDETPVAATPTFSPATGIFTGTQTVAISDSTPSSTIYYTTDGSTPTTSSSVYSTALTLSTTTTVKAIATASGFDDSAVGTALYTISCGATPISTGNIDPTQIKPGGRLGTGTFFQMATGSFTLGDLPDYDCNGNLIPSGTLLSSLPTASGIQQESYTYAADTGTANAYAVTLSPAPTIVAGSHVVFRAANANTGASTLAVNGGTATAIKKQGSTALAAGDISAGQIISVVYDGTSWQCPACGSSGGGTSPVTIGFVIGSGSTGTNVGPMLIAPRAGSITKCVVVTKASDGSTGLAFDILQNGTSIFSSTPTVSAGTSSGTLNTFTTLTSSPLSISANDIFTINITGGTSSWKFTAQLE